MRHEEQQFMRQPFASENSYLKDNLKLPMQDNPGVVASAVSMAVWNLQLHQFER